jgi:WD40 repeat protein
MNNKIIFSFIIFCCSNTLMSMEHRRTHTNQLHTWNLYKEINVAEKITGISQQKDITRKTDEYYISSICFDPSETSLATASCDQKIRIIDIASEEIVMSIDFKNDIASMCFDHSGKKFAVLSYKPTAHFFTIQRDESKKILPCDSYSSFDLEQEMSSMFFDNNNNAVGVVLDELNKKMNIINITQNNNIVSCKYNEHIKLGCVSPSKKYFATESGTNQSRLFDVQKGMPICIFTLQGSVTAFAFDKKEKLLAIASNESRYLMNEHKIQIFDLKTFQEIASLKHKKYISTVCFSASGKTLAFGSFDGKVYIFKRR